MSMCTSVGGHKCRWAQVSVGTNVNRHKLGGGGDARSWHKVHCIITNIPDA